MIYHSRLQIAWLLHKLHHAERGGGERGERGERGGEERGGGREREREREGRG